MTDGARGAQAAADTAAARTYHGTRRDTHGPICMAQLTLYHVAIFAGVNRSALHPVANARQLIQTLGRLRDGVVGVGAVLVVTLGKVTG